MNHFIDKVAVITGAGSGIGRALALALAKEGAILALSDVNKAGLSETLKLLPSGSHARTYKVDVTSQDDVFSHADGVKRDFGTAHLLFNNAGTSLVGLFQNQTVEEMRWLIDINMWGVVYGSKAFLPMMLAQRQGCIINMSSTLGLVGWPTHSAYNMTKFAVRGLTESLWFELEGTGVRAMSVHPGGIKTGLENRVRFAAGGGERERRMIGNLVNIMQTTPEHCASAILAGVRNGKRRVVTGHLSKLTDWTPRLFPASYPRLLRAFAR